MPGALILYHADCPDGFAAACAAWAHYGAGAEYRAVRHGVPAPEDIDGRAVFLLDFAYPRGVLEGWRARASSLEVHDHHKSAREDLEGFPGATFDMAHSGCILAWRRFRGQAPPPRLFLHIEDKDLWRFELQGTREVIAALRSHPMDFETWQGFLAEGGVERLAAEGEAILRYEQRTVEGVIAAGTVFTELAGQRVPAVNACVLSSEIANRLLQLHPGAPFAAVWFVNGEGREKWSLRSAGDFDVSVIAQGFGGGGHRNAAGFVRDHGD